MATTMTEAPTLVIRGRDNWTDARLAKIEKITGGTLWAVHHGNGDVTYTVAMRYVPRKAEKAAILKAVAEVAPSCRWR